jgi:hypothetical protein
MANSYRAFYSNSSIEPDGHFPSRAQVQLNGFDLHT